MRTKRTGRNLNEEELVILEYEGALNQDEVEERCIHFEG